MNLTWTIESAENQFKQILEEFFISVFNKNSLSSHGIDHHRRVWSYSKALLHLIPLKNTPQFLQLPSKLIIASYLHDIGMSVDPGARHGKHSRNLCIQFFDKNDLPVNDYNDVLEAIEYHDNKDYAYNTFTNDLLTILSVADDLDAFGFTGIYRYTEIYLTRGTNPEKIGYLIRDNAEKRINNFVKSFGYLNVFVKKHKDRFYILDNFFSKYNELLPSYHFGTDSPSGYCGVIEIFNLMIKNKIELEEINLHPEKYLSDPIIRWYFSELEKELSCF
jgi:HD domain